MFEVDITLKIKAPFEQVWDLISNLDSYGNYWREIRHIKNLSHERNVIVREIYHSNGYKYRETITVFPKEGIHMRWTNGSTSGIKDIMLTDNGNTTIIRVQINYKNGGAVRIGSNENVRRIQSETEDALQLIKKEAEHKVNTKHHKMTRKI